MKWIWPWNRRADESQLAHDETHRQLEEVQAKLDRVLQDDLRVELLVSRTDKVIGENNFALTVRRALGVRP